MPNCFQLTKKDEKEPSQLQKVDQEIADFMGVPCDEKLWCYGWYNSIGFLIAIKDDCNIGSQKLRDEVAEWCKDDPEYLAILTKILGFLEANYSSNGWYQVGR